VRPVVLVLVLVLRPVVLVLVLRHVVLVLVLVLRPLVLVLVLVLQKWSCLHHCQSVIFFTSQLHLFT